MPAYEEGHMAESSKRLPGPKDGLSASKNLRPPWI